MKKLLLLWNNLFNRNLRSLSASMLLLALVGFAGQSQAQVWFVTTSGNVSDATADDALLRINYDGSSSTTIASSVAFSPTQSALDIANNRIFVYEAVASTRTIKVINATTGAVTSSFAVIAGISNVNALEYDPINDYIYYLTTDGSAATTTATDALVKVKPDGTGSTVIASSFTPSPLYLALDIPNNRVFVYDGLTAQRVIKTINLSNGTATQTAAVNTGTVKDIAYDPASDYLYYLTSDDIALNPGATDALVKVKPDGTGTTVIASPVTGSPVLFALDAGNNRAFVYEGSTANKAIKSVDLSTGAVATIISLSSYASTRVVNSINAPLAPVVTTAAATSVLSASATLGGNVTRSEVSVTERGVVYSSTNTTPVIGGSGVTKAANGTGTGAFSASVTGLSGTTTYYARAYATSGAGTTYGSVISFTTLSTDANLSGLSISAGTLAPTFSTSTISYTASVPNATTSITVTPTKSNANASIKVNGTTVNSGTASGAISLSVGNNTITTVVTAQDGVTTKTYTITVTRAQNSQSITFNALPAKNYGNADFAPGATASSGLTVSYSSDNTAVATIVSGNIHIVGVGTANITASQAGDVNTLAASNVIQALTVSKAAITVTANAQTKVYGNNDPTLTYAITTGALVGSDAFTGLLTRAVGEDIGTYAITQGTLALSSNYILTYIGANLTITKRPVTWRPVNRTKIYGDPEPFKNQFAFVSGSLASTDGTTGEFGRAPGEAIGEYAMATIGTKWIANINTSANVSNNYDITLLPATFTITAKPITVTAAAITKTYGDADPTFTYSYYFDLVGTDAFTGALSRASGEGIGTYAITQGTLALSANYSLTYTGANLTIVAKTNADLAGITVSSGTLSPGFDAGTTVYTTDVPNGTTSITVTPTKADADAAIKVNGVTVSSGSASGAISLNEGANTITTIVTAQDGSTTKTYTLTVNRAPSADLSVTLSTSPEPVKDNEFLTYTFTVTNAGPGAAKSTALETTIPATLGDSYFVTESVQAGWSSINNGSGQMTFTDLNSGGLPSGASATFSYKVNTTAAAAGTVVATATVSSPTFDPDGGNNTATANTTVLSTNPNLSNIALSKGTLDPGFSSNTIDYTTIVPTETSSITITPTAVYSGSTITVNGATVASGSSSEPIALNPGENSIPTVVTAQDGVTTKTYTTVVTRTLDTNASLSGIYIGGDLGLDPVFDPSVHNYIVNVPYSTNYFEFFAFSESSSASIKVNGSEFTGYYYQNLNTGDNPVTIEVTAQNPVVKQTYTITVKRALSPNNSLTDITLSSGALNPVFDANTLSYTASVGNGIDNIDVQAFIADTAARYRVNGHTVPQNQPYNVALAVGANTLNFEVTAQNSDTKTYTVVVTRALSSNALLSNLSLSNSTLTPSFQDVTTSYSAIVGSAVSTIKITPTTSEPNATVTVNGTVVISGNASNDVPLTIGDNLVPIVVTAQDGATTQTYNVSVTRQSNVAGVGITLNAGTTFTQTAGPADVNVSSTVAYSVSSIRVKAYVLEPHATFTLNGLPQANNVYSDPIALEVGANFINVVGTAQDGVTTRSYRVTVTRTAAPANIADVSIALSPNITLTTTSGSANFNYAATVTNAISDITLTPTATSPVATIKLNGATVTTGTANPIALNTGSNTIDVTGTSQDGTVTKSYRITITRGLAGSNVAGLGITLNAGTPLAQVSGPADVNTASTVPYSVSSIRVKAYVLEPHATIILNGAPQANNVLSNPIALNVGDNIINVVGTAQDGITTRTYRITVTRSAPPVNIADLSFTLSPNITLANTTGSADFNYAATVANTINAVTVTPTATSPVATIKVNGVAVTTGTAYGPIGLNTGSNIISIVGTSQDGTVTKSYRISITRGLPGSNIAGLGMSLSAGTPLAQTSGPADVNTASTVVNGISSISVKAYVLEPNATITINGAPQASNVLSDPIALNVGDNIINVVGTAQDAITTRSYRITVTRSAPVPNIADLMLALNPNTPLTQVSGSADVNYTAAVANSVTQVSVIPTAASTTATITVNGSPVATGIASDPIALSTGTNIINVNGTSQDGTAIKTYRITLTRAQPGSNNAGLGISLSAGTPLVQVPGPADVNTASTVVNGISSISVKAYVLDPNATITLNGAPQASNVLSAPIALNVGDNVINVVGTAQDATTTRSYRIVVTRSAPAADQADLMIVLSPNTPLTQFSSSPNVINYTATVPNNVTIVRVMPTAASTTATITVNGMVVDNGTLSGGIGLNVGVNPMIAVRGTSQDGTVTKTYRIIITRAQPGSNNAGLGISLNEGTKLVQTAGPANVNVSSTVANSITSVRVKAYVLEAHATITLNGAPQASNVLSGPIALTVGDNIINVIGTAEDGTTTRSYRITVTRAAPALFAFNPHEPGKFREPLGNMKVNSDNDGVVVHQGVSPNGDGMNDFLTIEGVSAYKDNKLSIMNANGALVYETKDYGSTGSNLFDGHSNKNGSLLKPGTYFYSLEYKVDKESKRKTGYVILKY